MGDAMLEVKINPNMARNANILGIARELAALTRQPLKTAGTRQDKAVARVARPAGRAGHVGVDIAELVHEGDVVGRTGREGVEAHMLGVEAEIDRVTLRKRVPPSNAAADRLGLVRSDGER